MIIVCRALLDRCKGSAYPVALGVIFVFLKLAGAVPAAEMPPGRSGLYPGQYASGSGGTVSSNVASQVLSRLRPDISNVTKILEDININFGIFLKMFYFNLRF